MCLLHKWRTALLGTAMLFTFNVIAGGWVDPVGYSDYNPVLLNQAEWLKVEEPLPLNLKELAKKPEGMKVVSAVYGTHDNRRFKDVTEIVQDKVLSNGGFLKLTVSNSLFTDPAHGHGKRLKVVYTIGGKELVEEVRERGYIQLPRVKADYFNGNRSQGE